MKKNAAHSSLLLVKAAAWWLQSWLGWKISAQGPPMECLLWSSPRDYSSGFTSGKAAVKPAPSYSSILAYLISAEDGGHRIWPQRQRQPPSRTSHSQSPSQGVCSFPAKATPTLPTHDVTPLPTAVEQISRADNWTLSLFLIVLMQPSELSALSSASELAYCKWHWHTARSAVRQQQVLGTVAGRSQTDRRWRSVPEAEVHGKARPRDAYVHCSRCAEPHVLREVT